MPDGRARGGALCGYRYVYHLNDGRYGCERCRYNFGEFTETYLGKVYLPSDVGS